jgi:hypothetical protein
MRFITFALVLVFLGNLPGTGFGQKGKKPPKKAWPDSLQSVTLEGTVHIDSTHVNPYFLDVDGDGAADYNLAFGPGWYVPASGAVRPAAGDFITVVGNINPNPLYPVVIVFELNGVLWREPVENWWKHQEWCDSLDVVTVTGTVLVDTTYFYEHFYLDTDADNAPDYWLVFGPPWYEPTSGAVRPEAGVTVTVEAAVKETDTLTKLIVLKLDDQVWRDPFGPAPWNGGRWADKNKKNNFRIHCPIDTSSWLEIPPGSLQGGGKNGPQFPDSVFCEFAQVWRDSLVGKPDSVMFGWHFSFMNPAGKDVNGRGKAVRFVKRLRLQLNLCPDSTGTFLAKRPTEDYTLKYWDDSAEAWIETDDVFIDGVAETVTFETDVVAPYYAVFTSSNSTGIGAASAKEVPEAFGLSQNYPNPFNPTTRIDFQLQVAGSVKLSIYNLLGQEVRALVNESKPAGVHQVAWDGRDNAGFMLSSGTYLYKLEVGTQSQMKRLVLMK